MVEQFKIPYVYCIYYITCALGKRSVINKPSVGARGWTGNSMVTIHETKMVFLPGKISVWVCPARLWQDILKYVSLCVGALYRNYQGFASGECLRTVLEHRQRLCFRVIIYREFAYMAFYRKFCWIQGGPTSVTGTPCSWRLVASSFCLGSPKNLSVPIMLGDTKCLFWFHFFVSSNWKSSKRKSRLIQDKH